MIYTNKHESEKKRKKEMEKNIIQNNKELAQLGKNLLSKSEKRLYLEVANKKWEKLPKFLKEKINNKEAYVKEYLESECIIIAKKYKKDKEIKEKWADIDIKEVRQLGIF